jgi:hypothetical protein
MPAFCNIYALQHVAYIRCISGFFAPHCLQHVAYIRLQHPYSMPHAALLDAASLAFFHENNTSSSSASQRNPNGAWVRRRQQTLLQNVLTKPGASKPPASVALFSAREFLPRTVAVAVVVPTTAVVVALPVLKCGGLGAPDPSGTSLSCALAVRSLVQLIHPVLKGCLTQQLLVRVTSLRLLQIKCPSQSSSLMQITCKSHANQHGLPTDHKIMPKLSSKLLFRLRLRLVTFLSVFAEHFRLIQLQ